MMATNFYCRKILIGGTAGALDEIDGAGLNDLDFAIVSVLNTIYMYSLDDDSAAAEDSPNVVKPDANAGNKRWILQGINLPTENDAVTPTLRVGKGGGEGFYSNGNGALRVALAGLQKFTFINDIFAGAGGGGALHNETPSATNPVLAFVGDVDTGIGSNGADELSLIAGAIEALRIVENDGKTSIEFKGNIVGDIGLVSYENETVYFEDAAVFN
jgi:hypothetical protein